MNITTFVSDYIPLPSEIQVPEPLFICTDMHGCTQAFDRLLAHLPDDARPVFLGDAVDRGPDPLGVLTRLLDLYHKRQALLCRGNHDGMAYYSSLDDEHAWRQGRSIWAANGGRTTMSVFKEALSKGEERALRIPTAPKIFEDYWEAGKNYHLVGDILLVHAGLPLDEGEDFLNMDPRKASSQDDSPYWWRPFLQDEFYYSPRTLNGRNIFVISGHNPVEKKDSLQTYGILCDLGYQLKRAIELRPGRYRYIDTECDEIP